MSQDFELVNPQSSDAEAFAHPLTEQLEQVPARDQTRQLRNRQLLGMAALLFGALSYGLNVPMAGLANRSGVSGSEIILIRIAVLLIVILAYCRTRGISLKVSAASRPAILALGVISALVSLTYVTSIAFIPVGIAAMVFYTFPILVLLASPFVDAQKLTVTKLAAAATTFAGITLAIGSGLHSLDWRGVALAGLGSVGAAMQFFIGARAPGGGGLAMIFWLQVIMLPFACVSTLIWAVAPFTHLQAGAAPVFFAALGAIIGIFCQYFGLPRVGASLASLIFCLEPIVSTLFSGWLLGEILSPAQYIGGLLVISGILMSCLIPLMKAKS